MGGAYLATTVVQNLKVRKLQCVAKIVLREICHASLKLAVRLPFSLFFACEVGEHTNTSTSLHDDLLLCPRVSE